MSDSKSSIPFHPDILPEPLRDMLNSFVRGVYEFGFEQGSNFTVARIFMAVSPENQQVAPSQAAAPPSYPWSQKPRMETRTLIDAVLKIAGSKGATPTDIFKAPGNDGSISRQAIGKVLRRNRNKRYISRGGGKWVLMKSADDK